MEKKCLDRLRGYFSTLPEKVRAVKEALMNDRWKASLCILVLVTLGSALFVMGCADRAPRISDFKGTYAVDDYTAYQFDGKGHGALCLGDTTSYPFTYTLDGDTISFAFDDSRISGVMYDVMRRGRVLMIVEQNGISRYTMRKK